MRKSHFVTLGLSVGMTGLAAGFAGCGTNTFGTCQDDNACGGDGGDASLDVATDVVVVEDSPVTNDGGDGKAPGDGATDGKSDAPAETSVTCDAGTVMCEGACVDESTDPMNCGGCGKACAAVANGTATCAPGTDGGAACGFTCGTGFLSCNGQCLSTTDDPQTNPCLLTSSTYGVFVSPTGTDSTTQTGAGGPSAPYAHVSFALAHLPSGVTSVFVCNGAYSDTVNVTAAVGIFGGLSCAGNTWAVASGIATVTSSGAAGSPALNVTNVSGGVTIENMGFTSVSATGLDGSGNGASSIAGVISGSTNVTLSGVTFTAGDGVVGASAGPPTTSNHFGGIQTGNSASGGTGGGSLACICGDMTTSSLGGGGGNGETVSTGFTGTADAQGGDAGAATPPTTPVGPNNGSGGSGQVESFSNGSPTANTLCSGGIEGAAGSGGPAGGGAATVGSLTTSGWVPTPGSPGADGDPGQGGGGGGGGVAIMPGAALGGGGGSCGGCGGAGGLAGGAGGSSLALAIVSSTVSVSSPTLVAGNGKNAGGGGPGEVGQLQGFTSGLGSCQGGVGGPGAGGGGGGGGAGGSSIGIAVSASSSLTLGGSAVTTSIPSASYFMSAGSVGAGGGNGTGGGAVAGGNAGQQSTSQAVSGVSAAVEVF